MKDKAIYKIFRGYHNQPLVTDMVFTDAEWKAQILVSKLNINRKIKINFLKKKLKSETEELKIEWLIERLNKLESIFYEYRKINLMEADYKIEGLEETLPQIKIKYEYIS